EDRDGAAAAESGPGDAGDRLVVESEQRRRALLQQIAQIARALERALREDLRPAARARRRLHHRRAAGAARAIAREPSRARTIALPHREALSHGPRRQD